MKLKSQDRSWETAFTSFAASLSPRLLRALTSRPVGACFQLYHENIIKGIFFFYELKKIVVCSHLKKTLEEKVPKLCLLPSSFMRETKVVEAHLKRTISMESSVIERHQILGNSVIDDDVGKGGRSVEGCRKYLVSRIEMNTIEFTIMIRMVIFLDYF